MPRTHFKIITVGSCTNCSPLPQAGVYQSAEPTSQTTNTFSAVLLWPWRWKFGGEEAARGGLGNGRAEEAQSWGTCLLAGIIRTPIKAFQSATWQRSRVRWSQVSLGDKTLEREEDDQKWVLQNNKTKCKQDDQDARRVCGAIWEVVTASYCARSLCIILLYIFRLARQCIGKNKSTGCGKRKSEAPQRS